MHELSIAMSIVELALEEAGRQGNPSIVAVHLRVGELSGVVEEALRSAYEMAREGTALSGARLSIETVPVRIFCDPCKAERTVVSLQCLCCRECGAPPARVVSGRELDLCALEIEE
jgi:hydrogenase nickel incorporation protein HypA/HybF